MKNLQTIISEAIARALREEVEANTENGIDMVQDSSCDGDFQTYKVMIPADQKMNLDSFLKKSKSKLPDLQWQWSSAPRKQLFRHVATCYSSDAPGGIESRDSWEEEHTLYDLDVTYPVSCNGWQLIATVDHGILCKSNNRGPLHLSNPEHGPNYKKCDACGRPTEIMFYIVRNKNTGEEMQVGSGCAKKFGLGLMGYIYQFERELYKCFTYHDKEEYDIETGGRGANRLRLNRVIPVAEAFNAAMVVFTKDPKYYKGIDGTIRDIAQALSSVDDSPALLNKMQQLYSKYLDKDYEYYRDHINDENTHYRYDADWVYEDSFNCKIWNAVLRQTHIKVYDLWMAFFAVKKFKELEAIDARDISKDLSVGDVIQINGTITKTDTYNDSYYNKTVPVYWIDTDDGYHLKRTGVVPFDADTKRVEGVYAAIKWKSPNGEIYVLDRVTKNPKKGVKVVNLGESVSCRRSVTLTERGLRRMIAESLNRVLSEADFQSRKGRTSGGLCSIQEYNKFKTRIFDAIDEWLGYYDADSQLGIAINQRTLGVEICPKGDARSREWFPLKSLMFNGEADADAVLDLADQFCFVR